MIWQHEIDGSYTLNQVVLIVFESITSLAFPVCAYLINQWTMPMLFPLSSCFAILLHTSNN